MALHLRLTKSIMALTVVLILLSVLLVTSSQVRYSPLVARSQVAQDLTHPVADAGGNRSVIAGAKIMLNGSSSTDDIGITNYTWAFDDNGPRVFYGAIVYYTFWSPGNYSVTLNVTDGDDNWDTDTIIVTVRPDIFPPLAVPRAPNDVQVGTLVTLNGSTSRDVGGSIVNYTWNFTYANEQVKLYGPVVSFWFNETGKYRVWLTVTDGGGNSDSKYTNVTVSKPVTWLGEHYKSLLFWIIFLGLISWFVAKKYLRDKAFITTTDIDKFRLTAKRGRRIWKLFIATWMGKAGIFIIIFFLFVVLLSHTLFQSNPKTSEVRFAPEWWVKLLPTKNQTLNTTGKIFGTDQVGRDVLIRTMHGTQASLIIGFTAMALSMGLGTLVGLASGYWGGWRDEVIMRINDVFLSIPWLVLMIVIAAIWGRQNLGSVVVVIGVTGWSTTARIVRAQVLSLKTRMFVERSKAVGAGEWHIIGTHIFPNVVPLIFANAILTIAISILSESTLSFLGLGPQDVQTWGRILEDAYNQGVVLVPAQSLFLIIPGLCIVFVVLGFTFIGYAMDEVLNPRLRKR